MEVAIRIKINNKMMQIMDILMLDLTNSRLGCGYHEE